MCVCLYGWVGVSQKSIVSVMFPAHVCGWPIGTCYWSSEPDLVTQICVCWQRGRCIYTIVCLSPHPKNNWPWPQHVCPFSDKILIMCTDTWHFKLNRILSLCISRLWALELLDSLIKIVKKDYKRDATNTELYCNLHFYLSILFYTNIISQRKKVNCHFPYKGRSWSVETRDPIIR